MFRLSTLSAVGRLLGAAVLFAAAAASSAQCVVGWGAAPASAVPANLAAVADVSAGGYHSLALRGTGTVAAWGANESGQATVPGGLANVVRVAAGGNHSLALKADGTVVAWGSNASGQCAVPAGLNDAVAITAGFNHSAALRSNGTVTVWGSNVYTQRNVPTGLTNVVQIAAGGFFTLALKSDGTVIGWGEEDSGATDVPEGLSNVVQVAGGVYHALALRANGTIAAWGSNADGACNVPAGLTNVVQVAAGYGYSAALKADGSVVTWGRNTGGERNLPAGLAPVARLATGVGHSLALLSVGVELDQKTVASGGSATGTVSLAAPAEAGGATVALASDDARVGVPATVSVPAGSRTATFPVFTDLTFADVPAARITATLGARWGRTTLRVEKNVGTLKSSHATIVGGSATKPTLTLSLANVVTGDAVLSLSGDPMLGLPPTATVPAGQKSVKVPFTHGLVGADTVLTIGAAYGSQTVAQTTVKIAPFRATVSFSEPSMLGGLTTFGYVFLNDALRDGMTISLASSDPVASVPGTVRINAGARQALFTVSTLPVAAAKNVKVSATVNGNAYAGTLKVNPTPAVASVTLPTSVYGRSLATGTVRLKSVGLPGGTVVQLASGVPGLEVPSEVTVPEGQYAATFEVRATMDPPDDTLGSVTATSGTSSAVGTITVRKLALSSLVLSSSTVSGGSMLTGTVTLNSVVAFDTQVEVVSDDPALISVPTVVTIPAGSKTATFPISTVSTATVRYPKVTAWKNGTSKYRTLKVTP